MGELAGVAVVAEEAVSLERAWLLLLLLSLLRLRLRLLLRSRLGLAGLRRWLLLAELLLFKCSFFKKVFIHRADHLRPHARGIFTGNVFDHAGAGFFLQDVAIEHPRAYRSAACFAGRLPALLLLRLLLLRATLSRCKHTHRDVPAAFQRLKRLKLARYLARLHALRLARSLSRLLTGLLAWLLARLRLTGLRLAGTGGLLSLGVRGDGHRGEQCGPRTHTGTE